MTAFVLAVLFACLSGITYGYDICVIAGALSEMETYFTNTSPEFIVAFMSIGMLVSRLIGWAAADKFGRIRSLIVADLFVIGSILLTVLTTSGELLLFGRFVLGLGVGLALLVGPTYLSEISPKESRGRLVTLHELCVCLGSFMGFASGMIPVSWQIRLGVSAVPSLIQLVLTFLLPESPNWLLLKDRKEEAEISVRKLFGPNDAQVLIESWDRQSPSDSVRVDIELPNIHINTDTKSPSKTTSTPSLKSLFAKQYRNLLLISIAICVAGSATGFYVVQAFSESIVKSFMPEWSPEIIKSRVLPVFGAIKLIGVLLCCLVIDLLGRRCVLLSSFVVLILSNILIMVSGHGWPAIVGIAGIIFGWSLGLGSMMLLVANELLPTEFRAVTNSIALSLTSVVEIIYHLCFHKSMTISTLIPFGAFLGYSVFAMGITLFYVPETLGTNLSH